MWNPRETSTYEEKMSGMASAYGLEFQKMIQANLNYMTEMKNQIESIKHQLKESQEAVDGYYKEIIGLKNQVRLKDKEIEILKRYPNEIHQECNEEILGLRRALFRTMPIEEEYKDQEIEILKKELMEEKEKNEELEKENLGLRNALGRTLPTEPPKQEDTGIRPIPYTQRGPYSSPETSTED